MHSLYLNTCLKLRREIIKKKEGINVSNGFNQLFDQIIKVLQLIEKWTHYMHKSPMVYSLKRYVTDQVKKTYSAILWAILTLREQLFIKSIIPGIRQANPYLFEDYDKKIWKERKGKTPYWEVLGLKYPKIGSEDGTKSLKDNTNNDFYKSLKTTGNKVFTFLNSIVEYAAIEFENVKEHKNKFPDTMLLRTFTKLMGQYKTQLNGLSQKHLEFYYKDILIQKAQNAIADTVYICATLAKKRAYIYITGSYIV